MDQLALTPHGRLALVEDPDAPPLDLELAQRLRNAFERGSGHGLLQLGAAEAGAPLPPAFSYWREFGAGYVTALCTQLGCRGGPGAARRGVGPAGAGGASHDWRGVSDRGGPGRPLAGTGRRIRHRAGGIEMRDTGLSEVPEPRLEPGRPRTLQSGRKPQGPGCPFRLSRNLHHAAWRPMRRRNTFRWGRPSANMPARPTRAACCLCSFPCRERRRPARG